MSKESPAKSRWPIIIELGLLALIGAGLVNTAWFLYYQGYLPQPFFYGSQSLFTDWTVSAFFSHNPGTYTSFESVYPPLSFIFLKIFSISACYDQDDILSARDCDWMVPVTLLFFFFVNVVVAFYSYRAVDRRTAWMRTLAICFGLPSIYALERGNLIIPCMTFFMLGTGRALKSARVKWVCEAIAINFKPYLVLGLAGPLLRRKWRAVEGVALAGLLVYGATFAIFGEGDPMTVVSNILAFNTTDARGIFERAIYASSYKPIMDLIGSNFPLIHFLGSQPVETLEWVLPLLVNLGRGGIAFCFLVALIRPGRIPTHRLVALAIAWPLITQDPGGYAVVFFFFLVFMEPWRGGFRIAALVITYLASVPFDVIIMKFAHQLIDSYLTQREVGYDLGLNVGEVSRPALNLLIVYCLVCASLVDAAKGVRVKGEARAPLGDPLPEAS
ncbi:MAG TPA: hypothetical protein VGH03_03015 [Caulobacteraceae bacterium]